MKNLKIVEILAVYGLLSGSVGCGGKDSRGPATPAARVPNQHGSTDSSVDPSSGKPLALASGAVGGDDPQTSGAEASSPGSTSAAMADVQAAANALALPALLAGNNAADRIDRDLQLPTADGHGVAITWATSDAGVIAASGAVARPSCSRGPVAVTLTATFAKGGHGGLDHGWDDAAYR